MTNLLALIRPEPFTRSHYTMIQICLQRCIHAQRLITGDTDLNNIFPIISPHPLEYGL